MAFINMGGYMFFLLWTIVGLIVLTIITMIILFARNKAIFKYPVRIWRIRENGKKSEYNTKGGFIRSRSGTPIFRIKLGKFKKVDLLTTPNPAFMDEDNRVWITQLDMDTYVQNKVIMDKEIINVLPVTTDIKYGAIQHIRRVKATLDQEPTWKKLLPYLSLLILGVIFIIAYAILMNKCSG